MTECCFLVSINSSFCEVCVYHKTDVFLLTGVYFSPPYSPVTGTFPVLLQLPNGQTMPVTIPASITTSTVHIPTIPVSALLDVLPLQCLSVFVLQLNLNDI